MIRQIKEDSSDVEIISPPPSRLKSDVKASRLLSHFICDKRADVPISSSLSARMHRQRCIHEKSDERYSC